MGCACPSQAFGTEPREGNLGNVLWGPEEKLWSSLCMIKGEGDRPMVGICGSSFSDLRALGLKGSLLLSGSLHLSPTPSHKVEDLAQENRASLI